MNTPCGKSELQLFDKPHVQIAAERGSWSKIYPLNPVNGINNTSPIQFNLPEMDSAYYDLNDTALYMKCRITSTNNPAPVNNILGSMFEDVQLTINDKIVKGGDFLYPYKSYITCMLNYGKDAKKAWLRASGYVKDVDGKFNSPDNPAHIERMEKMGKKNEFFELMGPLHLALFHQSNYVFPNINIRLKLIRAKTAFCCNTFSEKGNDDSKLEILETWLRVRTVTVNPEVLRAHQSGLEKHNLVYPIQRCQMSTFTITKGVYSDSHLILANNHCPKLMIIGFVSNKAFYGSEYHNPFNFHHYDVNNMGLNVNGQDYLMEPMKLDFAKSQYMIAYMNMIQNLEEYCKSECNTTITYDGFAKGNSFFVFNFTPDLSYSAAYAQVFRQSSLRLDLNFAKELPENINVIMFALYDGQIEISKDKSIVVS